MAFYEKETVMRMRNMRVRMRNGENLYSDESLTGNSPHSSLRRPGHLQLGVSNLTCPKWNIHPQLCTSQSSSSVAQTIFQQLRQNAVESFLIPFLQTSTESISQSSGSTINTYLKSNYLLSSLPPCWLPWTAAKEAS